MSVGVRPLRDDLVQPRMPLAVAMILVLNLGGSTSDATREKVSRPPTVKSRRNATCLPPYWAGLLAGSSTEREARQLLGDGYSTERQGETVRLYTDSSRSTTLVIKFGTDAIVTS